MLKILVVDDEFVSRKKMSKLLKTYGDCTVAEDGGSAIACFREALEQEAPFDLVTLDIDMPDMDGTEVLFELRDLEGERHTPVMMVTSHSDRDTIITAVQAGCDDYIAKPFNRVLIEEKLVKVGLISDPGEEEQPAVATDPKSLMIARLTRRFQRDDINLPPLPEITFRFRRMLQQGAPVQEIAYLLSQDAAISSRLISLSNSIIYRGVTENQNLEQAINRLGLDVTRQAVDAIANRRLYAATSSRFRRHVETLWEHSLSCAHAAEILAELKHVELSEDPFTLGLLHDIGKLILLQVLGEISVSTGETLAEPDLEETLNSLHGQFGAALLERWQFSSVYQQVALHHDDLAEDVPLEQHVVSFANLLVKSLGYGEAGPDPLDSPAAKVLELGPLHVQHLKLKIERRMEELVHLYG